MTRGPAIQKVENVPLEKLFHSSPRNLAQSFIEKPSEMKAGLEELMRTDPQKAKSLLREVAGLVSTNRSGTNEKEVAGVLRDLSTSISEPGLQANVRTLANQVRNLALSEQSRSGVSAEISAKLDTNKTVNGSDQTLSQATLSGVGEGVVSVSSSRTCLQNAKAANRELPADLIEEMKVLDECLRRWRKREAGAYRLIPYRMLASGGEALAHQSMSLGFTAGSLVAAFKITLHALAVMDGVPHAFSWTTLVAPFAAYGVVGLVFSPVLYFAHKVRDAESTIKLAWPMKLHLSERLSRLEARLRTIRDSGQKSVEVTINASKGR